MSIKELLKQNFPGRITIDFTELLCFTYENREALGFYIIERLKPDGHYINEAVFHNTHRHQDLKIIFKENPLSLRVYNLQDAEEVLLSLQEFKNFLLTPISD